MNIDFAQLKELLEIFSQGNISELTVELGEERITVKRPPAVQEFSVPPHMVAHGVLGHAAGTLAQPAQTATMPAAPPTEQPEIQLPGQSATAVSAELKNSFLKITSPMVGTFYRSSSPDKPAFVEVGDIITVGQTVCIIEAMKLMNDLPAEISGRIVEIPAQNGATVEYGQPLFLVDPHV